jgi:MFS family permease
VLIGGVIASKYGWKAAFGVVGIPGLVLALLYLFVRDYKTVPLTAPLDRAAQSTASVARHVALRLARTRTLLWVCVGAAMQLIVVSAVWSWLPSYLNRFHGMPSEQAARQAAMVVLVGALGSFVWGTVVDRLGARRGQRKLHALAVLCLATLAATLFAFAGPLTGSAQLLAIAVGGFMMTCTVGVVAAVALDVIHPGVRSTGAAVLSLFQNLFGLAVGPFLAGVLSDVWGLQQALSVIPLFSLLAAVFFVKAARSYEADVRRVEDVPLDVAEAAHGPVAAAA